MIEILKNRFEQHKMRHPDVPWEVIEPRLRENKEALEALRQMEESGDLGVHDVGPCPQELKQLLLFAAGQCPYLVNIFQASFPQQKMGHLCIAGVGLADEPFLNIVLAAG